MLRQTHSSIIPLTLFTLSVLSAVQQQCSGFVFHSSRTTAPPPQLISCKSHTGDVVKEKKDDTPAWNMTSRNITMALLLNVENLGEGNFFGGAFLLALDDLHEYAEKKGIPVRFSWVFKETMDVETTAVKQVIDTYYPNKTSVFIGPNTYCRSAAAVVTAMNRPLIIYDCPDSENSGHHLIANTETRFYYVSKSILSLMLHFNWRSFWLVAGQSKKWAIIVKRLKDQLDSTNITITDEDTDDHNDNYQMGVSEEVYNKIVDRSLDKTRVYLFLGNTDSMVVFMRALNSKAGENIGKYSVITLEDDSNDYTNDTRFYLTSLEQDGVVYESNALNLMRTFQNLLIIARGKRQFNIKDFEERVKAKNNLPPINANENFKKYRKTDLNDQPISRKAYTLYDATMIYGKAVMSLMATPGKDPENALHVIERLRCHNHDSILHEKFWIHENGQSEGSYVLMSLEMDEVERPGHLAIKGKFNVTDPEQLPVYQPMNDIDWASGQLPESDPECGMNDEYCREEGDDVIVSVNVVIPISAFLVVAVILFFCVRHYVYEKRLDRLAWKIESDEIHLLNEGQFHELTTPSRNRKKTSANAGLYNYLLVNTQSQSDISQSHNELIRIGFHRGAYVAVKELTRKHMELTRVLKKQMQLRKELTHENVNRFIGACFEPPMVYIVTQYCPRKSLKDILHSEDAHLDNMFRTSLVQDLIRGMTFIHESQFGYHGNLKSSNCLVDSRWTLKISDFGFGVLSSTPRINFDDEKSFAGLLWTAPELLQKRRCSNSGFQQQTHRQLMHSVSIGSNSSACNSRNRHNKNHNKITETQKGDVYSFAIILYELYGRAGPWGHIKMSPREIIKTLIQPSTAGTRPDTSELNCDTNIIGLINDCWQQDHNHRPDFKGGIRAQFKPIQQGYLKSNIFDNMLAMMEKYANNLEAIVAERTELLRQEEKMNENLLLSMLPRSVAQKLKRGHRVEPEQYEQVSIYFSDIVGFTELSANSTPMEVVDLLNDLYTSFDSIIEEFDVYKVETIGDAYMVVSGLPIRNGDKHAGEIASMALELLGAIRQKKFKIQGSTSHMLKIRIGIHSGEAGPCCAGVVGLKMPRYCLFGDTVNTASRMESTGEALKIHCSANCKKILDKLGGYTLEERGLTEMKGKGKLQTYFLMSEDPQHRQRRLSQFKKTDRDRRSKVTEENCSRFQFLRNMSINIEPSKNFQDKDSGIPDCLAQHHQPTSHYDRLVSTLPRSCGSKYSADMLPIAKDPIHLDRMSTLRKSTSFSSSSFVDVSPSSETEPLLVTTTMAWDSSSPKYMVKPQHDGQLSDRFRRLQAGMMLQRSLLKIYDGEVRPDSCQALDSQVDHPEVTMKRAPCAHNANEGREIKVQNHSSGVPASKDMEIIDITQSGICSQGESRSTHGRGT
ncbi:Receptor-type guanylate cyclase Gyc76C [Bulinus truncatus]|nr:Receptor-type guanylate cyclase Gyc76C [Bulinus truncatus]